ncbi:hypothetical protein JR316_0012677 [Psilocybe cubensis]|uniref:Uncharacterized protein n=2 Tax=Psilocybe cubensis TaxID=181762 RepID=A0ACB8GJ63_PSICU|nr:hypothetical protein JR316_0012677 [Psilocybe cubensis]KAH9475561.1 hypothetical protein JR316_0012677 [Psilocybe cubensis]
MPLSMSSIPDLVEAKDILPKPLKASSARASVSQTLANDKSVLHLKWNNLDEFVKWKLDEEKRLSIQLVSGLTHHSAHAYAQQHGGIIYLCRHNGAESKVSCPSFLSVQLPSDRGSVTAIYNKKHVHTQDDAEKSLKGTAIAKNKGKKPAIRVGETSKQAEVPSACVPINPLSSKAKDPSVKSNTLPAHSSNGTLDWDDVLCNQYSHDIINSIANLELKKHIDVGVQTDNITDRDSLPSMNIPQHNWNIYAHAPNGHGNTIVEQLNERANSSQTGANHALNGASLTDTGLPFNSLRVDEQHDLETSAQRMLREVINSMSDTAMTVNNHLIELISTENTKQPVLYPNSTTNQDAASGPQPLGDHNSSSVIWPTTTADKQDPPSRHEPENSHGTVSEVRKRKQTDANDNVDNVVQDSDKRARSGWGLPTSGGESFAFYGALPESSSSALDTSDAEWFTPAPDAVSGGQPIENWDTWWPDDVLSWGEADWEKAINAAYEGGFLASNVPEV